MTINRTYFGCRQIEKIILTNKGEVFLTMEKLRKNEIKQAAKLFASAFLWMTYMFIYCRKMEQG